MTRPESGASSWLRADGISCACNASLKMTAPDKPASSGSSAIRVRLASGLLTQKRSVEEGSHESSTQLQLIPLTSIHPSPYLSRDRIGEKHVRYLSRIKDLNARIKLAKRAAEEGWTVRVTEERVAKVLAKAGKGPRRSLAKAGPAHDYDYNGFHCALLGDEVVVSGRNFKRTKDLVRQFVAEYQSALECFLRDIDAASADQPAADRKDGGAGLASTGVAPSAGIASPEVATDLMK